MSIQKSFFLVVIALFIGINTINADEVTKNEARKIALNCFYEKANNYDSPIEYEDLIINETLERKSNNSPVYYIFTFEPKGFVIVSAEDGYTPIIGYSINGFYSEANQPESFSGLMNQYADQINYIRENGIDAEKDIKSLWNYYLADDFSNNTLSPRYDEIEPLLTCTWNQSYPYNAWCPFDPEGSGDHVYAGCVATAMAQIMFYWRYPLQGTGQHTYYCGGYGSQTANFGETFYQWDAMENSIRVTLIDPIAELQYHCGVAVEMNYGAGGSGASSHDVPDAMEDYFGYDQSIDIYSKGDYTNSSWRALLKSNIDLFHPLYNSGCDNDGCHAFVCDGYQDDFFHYNFGWSGNSDGYYAVTDVGGYSSWQSVVGNIFPGSNYPYSPSGQKNITSWHGTIEDGSGPVANYENDMDCSWLLTPQTGQDSVQSITISFDRFDLEENDLLTIYDGSEPSTAILGSFTGNEIPETITSTSNVVLIKFSSDVSNTSNGWMISYSSNLPDFCESFKIITEPSGEISDKSGNKNYLNNSVCKWAITPEDANTLTLFFSAFNTEEGMDRLRIYDYESQELLADYSGVYSADDLPPAVTSESGSMFILFSTNQTVTAPGWEANYQIDFVGIDDENIETVNNFEIYPNPANNILILKFNSEENQTFLIKISDKLGKIVYKENTELFNGSFTKNIDVSNFAKGMYIISLRNEKGIINKKVIIN
ncbi:MAG: C10 family peptidase [Bacteroidales bacterium]|nr:C10 family peptidase [Bacteroidales bacterium]